MMKKKYKEVDSTEREAVDEASYYDGDQFELGGVEFGDSQEPSSRQQLMSSLEAHFDIKNLRLEFSDETVTLSGEVDTLEKKAEIEKFLQGFPEIAEVQNELSLLGETGRQNYPQEMEDADRFRMG
jgi:hypothetical protein